MTRIFASHHAKQNPRNHGTTALPEKPGVGTQIGRLFCNFFPHPMLDSAKIYFNSDQFSLISNKYEDSFTVERQIFEVNSKQKKELSYIRNVRATKSLKASWGGYFPKIFIQRFPNRYSPYSFQLGVELSVPKFLYGSSFYEFDEMDIDLFAERLKKVLYDVGIVLNAWQVPLGTVTRLDYCKNFPLPPAISGHRFFRVVKQYELKNTADFGDRDYVNGKKGELVRFFQKNMNLRVYEKVAEIQYRPNTDLEKAIATNPPVLAMPRIELAIHDSRTFHAVMSEARKREGLVEKDRYTVLDLFKKRLSQRVLTTQYREVVKPWATGLITTATINDDVAFDMTVRACSSFELACVVDKLRRDTQAIGIKSAFKQFQKNHTVHKSPASFYRLQAEVKSVLSAMNLSKNTPSFDVLRFVRNELKQFQLLRPPPVQPTLPIKPIV